MKLTSEKITLAPLELQDIELIHYSSSDYAKISPFFTTYIRSKNYWEKRFNDTGLWDDDYGMLKIINNSDNKLIGVIWFFKGLPYASGKEIGFNIFDKEERSRGFATEALEIFASYIFDTFDLNRLQCNTLLPSDHPSIKNIAERTNFIYEGTMRKAMFIRGKYIDLNLFSLLREDSKPLNELVKN